MDELLHLLPGRGEDARMIVAGIDHGDTGEAIEIIAAIVGGQRAAAGTDDHNRLDALSDHGEEELCVLFAGVHKGLLLIAVAAAIRNTNRVMNPVAVGHCHAGICAVRPSFI